MKITKYFSSMVKGAQRIFCCSAAGSGEVMIGFLVIGFEFQSLSFLASGLRLTFTGNPKVQAQSALGLQLRLFFGQ